MNKEQLMEFLKQNLEVKVAVTENKICVKLLICNELISESESVLLGD